MPRIDFGKLTEEETVAIAKEALGNLSMDEKIKVVMLSLDETELQELAAHIDD